MAEHVLYFLLLFCLMFTCFKLKILGTMMKPNQDKLFFYLIEFSLFRILLWYSSFNVNECMTLVGYTLYVCILCCIYCHSD